MRHVSRTPPSREAATLIHERIKRRAGMHLIFQSQVRSQAPTQPLPPGTTEEDAGPKRSDSDCSPGSVGRWLKHSPSPNDRNWASKSLPPSPPLMRPARAGGWPRSVNSRCISSRTRARWTGMSPTTCKGATPQRVPGAVARWAQDLRHPAIARFVAGH